MLIAENIDYKIHYVDRETDLLVLSFSHMDFNADVQPYWGRGALEKLGLSVLGITAKANDWYPDSFLDLPIFSLPLRHKFRIGYGFSMGGYGAIKFSRALCADVTLSLSPQFSIDPKDGDGRFSNFHPAPRCGGRPLREEDTGGKTVIVFDPNLYEDNLAAQKIQSISADVEKVLLPDAGHFTSNLIASTEKLGRIFSCLHAAPSLMTMEKIAKELSAPADC